MLFLEKNKSPESTRGTLENVLTGAAAAMFFAEMHYLNICELNIFHEDIWFYIVSAAVPFARWDIGGCLIRILIKRIM